MVIYKTVNLINGKIYIGKDQINSFKYYGSGKILKLAIKKYGVQNFKKEIIEKCNDINELNEHEKYWIKKFNSTNKKIGYNITEGGTGGDTLSNNPNIIEIGKKISKANSGKNNANYGRGKEMSGKNNPFYRKQHTEKSKKINSERHNDLFGAKNPNYGNRWTEEQRKRASLSHQGKHNHTEEWKKEHSKKLRASWAKRKSE